MITLSVEIETYGSLPNHMTWLSFSRKDSFLTIEQKTKLRKKCLETDGIVYIGENYRDGFIVFHFDTEAEKLKFQLKYL